MKSWTLIFLLILMPLTAHSTGKHFAIAIVLMAALLLPSLLTEPEIKSFACQYFLPADEIRDAACQPSGELKRRYARAIGRYYQLPASEKQKKAAEIRRMWMYYRLGTWRSTGSDPSPTRTVVFGNRSE